MIISVVSLLMICLTACNKIETYNSDKRLYYGELKKFSKLLKDEKPAFSLKQAKNFAEYAIPIVEETAGRAFKQKPKIEIMSTKELEQLLIKEYTSDTSLNNSEARAPSKTWIEVSSKLALGIYDKNDQTIFLFPQRYSSRLKLYKLDKNLSFDLAKRVILHELVHALQDQHINLDDSFRKTPGDDEYYAFSAVIEGHATFIEELVAGHLTIDDRINKLPPISELKEMHFADPEINQAIKNFMSVYEDGKQFIEHYYKIGGNRLLWEILEFPPVDSAMVLYPETYQFKDYDQFNYKNILEDFRKILKEDERGELLYRNNSFSKIVFRYYLDNFSPYETKKLLSNIGHTQALSVYHKDNLLAQIRFIILKDRNCTEKILKLLEKMQNNILKADDVLEIQEWSDMYLAEMFSSSINSARWTSITYNFRTDNDEIVQKTSSYYIFNNGKMVVMISDGLLHSHHRIKTIAAAIFKKYRQATDKKQVPLKESAG